MAGPVSDRLLLCGAPPWASKSRRTSQPGSLPPAGKAPRALREGVGKRGLAPSWGFS